MTDTGNASPLRNRSGRFAAALVALTIVAVASMFAGPVSPAYACSTQNPLDCLPGRVGSAVDCLDSPTPAMPDTGATSFFISEPPPTPANNQRYDSSLYDDYGYAGLQYRTYDLGCGPDGAVAPDALINTSVANMIFGIATFLVGLANAVREYAYDPQSMWGWTDELIGTVSKALYDRVFTTLGLVVVVIIGIWLMWSSRRGDMSAAATTAGWALLVMVVTTAIAAWPLRASTAADSTLTGALATINGALHPQSMRNCGSTSCVEDRTPQRQASGVITDVVLHRQWLAGTLGSADSPTAKKYGERLFASSALTWDETREIRGDPSRRPEIVKRKKEEWKTVAAEIKKADPDAYEYLTGQQGSARIGAAFTAFIAALVAVPFDIMASILIIVAFLIIRLAVAFLPAIATVAILRPASGPLRGLFRTVVAAIINCVIFGIGASVYLLAVELITKTKSLAGWQQILLIWLSGLVMWLLLRPFRRLTTLTGKDPFSELAGGLGKMHRKVFGDIKQLAIAGAGTYLGDVAALEANDKRRITESGSGQARPESWSRVRPEYGTADRGTGASRERQIDGVSTGTALPRTDGSTVLVSAGRADRQQAAESVIPLRDAQLGRSQDADPLPVETADTYLVYRPDRGYHTVSADTERERTADTQVRQAAAAVAQVTHVAREMASTVGTTTRSSQWQDS